MRSQAMRSFIVAAAAALLAVTPAGAGAADQYYEIPGVREFTGQLIARPLQIEAQRAQGVGLEAAVARFKAAHDQLRGLAPLEYVPQTDEYILAVPAGRTEIEVIDELMATGRYQYVEPNWLVFPVGCPNDPLFGNQWQHQANRMDSCAGWNLHTGDPTTAVAICDTGVRLTHQDLQLHRLEGYNAYDRLWESQGGQVNDINGHGTATTGCAAANGNNGLGVAGVGWNLSHRMVRVTNDPGGGAYLSTLQNGARTAIENGDKVASVSYSGVDSNGNLTTATYIKSIGGLLVWAAGNDNRNLTFGNRDADDLIVAGGTDQGDNKASFSAYGPFVDVMAPAVDVYTTSNSGNASYGGASGTSFACPLTAGLCALIFSSNPHLEPSNVEYLLKAGCDDLGAAGVDNTYAYGRINVNQSLQMAQTYCVGDDITQQPQPQDACVHDNVVLSVTATVGSPSYQWYKDGAALSDGGNVSGSTTATLSITDALLGNAGTYHCEVTNGATGCVRTSDAATVTVGLCGLVTTLVRNDTVPTSGADLASFDRNATHHTFDLIIDTAGYPADWTASEFALDVVAPAQGQIWHASDETNFGPPLENLDVPFLGAASTDTRAFDTFVSPPQSPFFTSPSLASPGGLVSTTTKIRGISGQGNEIPLAWFDTLSIPAGVNFVGARITFETFGPGTISTDPGGELFATISGRTASVVDFDGEPFAFSLYFTAGADCPADLNGDGQVDLADLSILLTHFGSSGGPADGDLNGDGNVDLADLSILLVDFGSTCP